MTVANHEDFLTLLAQCQLLAAGPFAEVCTLPPDEPPRFANLLVERGYLTRWQADQLLMGNHQLLIGGYKLLDKIGEGGMGTVFKAQHARTTRVVALKLMSEKGAKQPQSLKRFQREIRTSATLDHPHIVSAFDADHVGDLHFLVMEYVVGRDLRTWLREYRDIPIAWACECIAQAAEGLQHAHQHGLVHRDIKPGNLMVIGDNPQTRPFVKVLDLGLARQVDPGADFEQLTKTGHVLGTIDYIAPEQVANTRTVDIRGDIFALGCTLFKAMTGRPPFPGRNTAEKVLARMQGEAPPPSSLRPEVSPGLDAVLGKMLAREPDDRYQTPAEVVAALTPYRMPPDPTAPTAQYERATNTSVFDSGLLDGLPAAAVNTPADQRAGREPSTSGQSTVEGTSTGSPTTMDPGPHTAEILIAYQARIEALEATVQALTQRLAALEDSAAQPPPTGIPMPVSSGPKRARWTRRP